MISLDIITNALNHAIEFLTLTQDTSKEILRQDRISRMRLILQIKDTEFLQSCLLACSRLQFFDPNMWNVSPENDVTECEWLNNPNWFGQFGRS